MRYQRRTGPNVSQVPDFLLPARMASQDIYSIPLCSLLPQHHQLPQTQGWSQRYLSHTHIPQTPDIYTIPFQSVFLLTRGPSHGFFVCHSDVWLAVVNLHFIWEWGWFPQSLNSQESFTVRVQKWGQFIVVALPSECPGHRATHCASVQFRCVLKD